MIQFDLNVHFFLRALTSFVSLCCWTKAKRIGLNFHIERYESQHMLNYVLLSIVHSDEHLLNSTFVFLYILAVCTCAEIRPVVRFAPADVPHSDVPRSDVPRSDVPRSDVPCCAQEEQNRGKPNWEHLNEELHVLITVEDTRNRCEMKLRRAVDEVKKLLVPAVSVLAPHRATARCVIARLTALLTPRTLMMYS